MRGTLCRYRVIWCHRRDHPRVCGEHRFSHLKRDRATGSSPRVRGTPQDAPPRSVRVGIIPACAGNTFLMLKVLVFMGDHPRVCGEHRLLDALPWPATGSSPRVRGTRVFEGSFEGDCGIIPACAGNTLLEPGCMSLYGDHPRVCGEHKSLRSARPLWRGSSPRVRGTQWCVSSC